MYPVCFGYNFILFFAQNIHTFIGLQSSFLCFSLFPCRSTMTVGDMFLLVLIVLVLPCSSLEGKCLVTKHSLSRQTLNEAFC